MLIKAFKSLFDNKSTDAIPDDEILAIAAGVLMFEVVLADDQIDDAERKLVVSALGNILDKGEKELAEVYKRILEVVEESVSLFEFTTLINEEFSKKEKYSLLIVLWRIAYADGRLDKYEEYYIRKIKDLLYLSQSDFIRAKHEASSSV